MIISVCFLYIQHPDMRAIKSQPELVHKAILNSYHNVWFESHSQLLVSSFHIPSLFLLSITRRKKRASCCGSLKSVNLLLNCSLSSHWYLAWSCVSGSPTRSYSPVPPWGEGGGGSEHSVRGILTLGTQPALIFVLLSIFKIESKSGYLAIADTVIEPSVSIA